MRAPSTSISRRDHRELLAAVAREDVLGADRLRHHAGDGGQHGVTGQVTVGVVDLLEVVDVDEQQRQRLLVPDREADLRVQAIDEVAAVEGRRQAVAQRRLEQLLLIVLVDLVLVREAEDRRRADRDLVAVGQVVTRDPATVAERAVGRAQVDQHHLAAVAFDRGVLARDAVVEHPDVGALAAAERRALALELIHLPEAGPRDDDQVRARAPASARRRRDGRRSVECGVFQRLRHPASMLTETGRRRTVGRAKGPSHGPSHDPSTGGSNLATRHFPEPSDDLCTSLSSVRATMSTEETKTESAPSRDAKPESVSTPSKAGRLRRPLTSTRPSRGRLRKRLRPERPWHPQTRRSRRPRPLPKREPAPVIRA